MKKLIIVLLLSFEFLFSNAQTQDSFHYSPTYLSGIEALQEERYDTALEYFKKEVADNPQNGYAWSLIAIISNENDDLDYALEAINKAIPLFKNDKEALYRAYRERSHIYLNRDEQKNALSDLSMLIKLEPDSTNGYKLRGNYYYEVGSYKKSNADFREIVQLAPDETTGYMGIGRNLIALKEYDKAIAEFNHCMEISPDYSQPYSFRGEAYYLQGKLDEAANDAFKALELDYDRKAWDLVGVLADTIYSKIDSMLTIKHAQDQDNTLWYHLHGMVSENNEHYREAINYYLQVAEKDPLPQTWERLSKCFENIGELRSAITCLSRAYDADTTRVENLLFRADLEDKVDMFDMAFSDISKFIVYYPEEIMGYYQRAYISMHTNNLSQAIEDFTKCIELDSEDYSLYMMRAYTYMHLGDTITAMKDWEYIAANDKEVGVSNAGMYALFWIGQPDKALAWLDQMLLMSDDISGAYYDASCLHSIMGHKKEAIDYLRKAIDAGFNDFNNIRHDWDLDNIRELPEFRELISQYDKVQPK